MSRRSRILLAALLWLVAGPLTVPLAVAQAPQVSLLTVGPGEIYWQRFGHNALLVRDAASGQATVYNYGVFDFNQENFFLNFARGRMQYRLDTSTLAWTLREYQAEGRWLLEQPLNLDAAQRAALAEYLAWNARPENAEYRYDYFRANCSTRVRDALDRVLHGQIEAQLAARPTALTYRSEALALMAAQPALRFGMQLALGRAADGPLSEWQAGFIPMHLMDALRTVEVVDGEGRRWPLVADERWLLQAVPGSADAAATGTAAPGRGLLPDGALSALAAGLCVAALWAWAAATRRARGLRRVAAASAALYLFANGLAGMILLLGWLLTDHWVMAANPTLLLLDPLWWALLPRALGVARSDANLQAQKQSSARSGRSLRRSAGLPFVLTLATLGWLALAGGTTPWLWALLPVHAAVLWRLRRG